MQVLSAGAAAAAPTLTPTPAPAPSPIATITALAATTTTTTATTTTTTTKIKTTRAAMITTGTIAVSYGGPLPLETVGLESTTMICLVYVSYSLNCSKGDYLGEYYRGY